MRRLVPALLLGALGSCASSSPAVAPAGPRHWLLVVSGGAEGYRVTEQVLVEEPIPERRSGRTDAVIYRLRDAEGDVLYTGSMPDPRFVRGEFPGEDGTIEGTVTPAPEVGFMVRVPVLAAARTITFEAEGDLVPFSVQVPPAPEAR